MEIRRGIAQMNEHTRRMIRQLMVERIGTHVAAMLLMTAAAGCGSSTKNQPDANDASAASNQVIPVEVAVPEYRSIEVTSTYTGTLEGEDQANILAKISERITGINVHVGEAVRSGQVIIALDKSGASSQYYQAEANFKNAEKTLERMKSLYGEGAVSLQTLDGAQTAFDVARANFDGAKSTVELATPIGGVVTAVNVSTGDLTVPGTVLATIAKIDRMKVIFNINERDVMNLVIGQKVRVYNESRSDLVVEGQIVQISKSADTRSRSFEIRALFRNTPDRWFKPGLFCRVDVQVSPKQKTLVIPNGAIQSDGITDRVFVVSGGRAYQRTVKVGVSDGRLSEILQGLSGRDTVATVGVTTVRDSGYVRAVPAPR